MSESQLTPAINPVLKPHRLKSFGGLLTAALLKAAGVFVLYFFIGAPVPSYPQLQQEAELRGATDSPGIQAKLAEVKAADEANLAAHHLELLIGAATAVVFLGLAFWARVEPFLPSVIALGLYAAVGLRTLGSDFSAIVYDLVAVTSTPAGSVSLALSVLILPTLIYAILASRARGVKS